MSLHLTTGSLVVFEGLDRSGKSTQIKRLSALDWVAPAPRFIHMPSGMTDLTKNIYSLTENSKISSPLARQLLHIACHAENIEPIADARVRHGLFLDRWWWSTVAYGWYGAGLAGARRDCNFNGVTPDNQGDTSDRRDNRPGPGRAEASGGR
jgi:dTMP kinase